MPELTYFPIEGNAQLQSSITQSECVLLQEDVLLGWLLILFFFSL